MRSTAQVASHAGAGAVDDVGRKFGERTIGTTTPDHLALLTWAEQFGAERLWAVEDWRHLSRRLERDLLGAAERIVRVPPKMIAQVRDSGRTYGRSDPTDALPSHEERIRRWTTSRRSAGAWRVTCRACRPSAR